MPRTSSAGRAADLHAASPDYDVDLLATDPDLLSEVVRFDLPRLGDIEGLRRRAPPVPHRHRHALARPARCADDRARLLGPALTRPARDLAAPGGPRPLRRVGAVRRAAVLGDGTFDLVFTGVGALCWLPDIEAWATMVAALLRPGGRLFLREGHPMLWSLDDPRQDGLVAVEYPYFEVAGGTSSTRPGPTWRPTTSSSSPDVRVEPRPGRDHHRADGAGLQLTALVEHDCVPWPALPGDDGAPARRRVPPAGPAGAPGAQLHAAGRQAPLTAAVRNLPLRAAPSRPEPEAGGEPGPGATGERSARLGPCPIGSPSPSTAASPTSA